MADLVNKDKQSKLDKFINTTPKSSAKRDQPASSPDLSSPSSQQVEKQAKLKELETSPSHDDNHIPLAEHILAKSIENETVFKLSEVVCATLNNQAFINTIIPMIAEKIMDQVKPKIIEIVDDRIQPYIDTITQNKDALILQEAELKNKNIGRLLICTLKSDRPVHDVPPLKDPNQNYNLAYESSEKSEILNKYFCSIANLENPDKDLPVFNDRCADFLSSIVVRESISENNIVIPDLLYNFLALLLTDDSKHASISPSKLDISSEVLHRRIMSLAQDLIYSVSKGYTKTPKHVALAIYLKTQTGSSEIVKIINKFGHSVSYDQVEEIETSIAEQMIMNTEDDIFIPSIIRKGVFSSFCWDNNDLCEETLSGQGTTHCTNGIVIQTRPDWCENVKMKQTNHPSKGVKTGP
ncbi:unnamed protein product [Mytilus coruscus]|uniref:Uncharacterized protein n=1 Tax=Mytilus coruscus TaxID=42192 RepID=A0A6J8CZQ8_MYTCO|nr:unnamed protein product [Mytilus coruscus]